MVPNFESAAVATRTNSSARAAFPSLFGLLASACQRELPTVAEAGPAESFFSSIRPLPRGVLPRGAVRIEKPVLLGTIDVASTRKSRHRLGRPTVPADVRDLIRTMSRVSPLWHAPRIHSELLKLGIDVSQASVAKYLVRGRRPPSQSWRTFLTNHVQQIMAADFFVVPTAGRLLFVLVMLAHPHSTDIMPFEQAVLLFTRVAVSQRFEVKLATNLEGARVLLSS